jgi:membrane associated rhomboid family serine protease
MNTSNRVLTTPVLLVAVLLGYLVQVVYGSGEATARFSGYVEGLHAGELWRLITPTFLHSDPRHLVANLAVLLFCGIALEIEIGAARVAAITVAAAVLGTAAAMVITPEAAVVGASTVAYGYAAALAVVSGRNGKGVLSSGAGLLLIMGAVHTAVVPGVSVGGHLGGAAAGVVLAWVGWRVPSGVTLLAAAALTLVSAGLVSG